MDATTREADPRLRQGSGRVVAAAEEVVAAAAADGFIDWHCRHRPEESVSGVRELCADGSSRFSWSWVRGRFLPRWRAESHVFRLTVLAIRDAVIISLISLFSLFLFFSEVSYSN